jgi:hypothetical protein
MVRFFNPGLATHRVTHRYDAMTSGPPLSDELKERPEHEEHCSVSVTHESEWCLGVQAGATWLGKILRRAIRVTCST